jgi:glycosyltransferase involved in cell wall biosynthesis
MTGSAEQARIQPEEAIGSRGWREATQRRQEEALDGRDGRVVLTCSAQLGRGGLGRHAAEIFEALQRRGQQPACVCGGDPNARVSTPRRMLRRALNAPLALPPLHLAAGQRALLYSRRFDRYAAATMPSADHLIAFNGTSLQQIRNARAAGAASTALVSATSHLRLLAQRHALAHRQYPLEESWAARMVKRNLSEYAEVDRIYVASSYVRDSFIAEGVSEELLVRLPLTPDPRFTPDPAARGSATFDVVFCGSLSVVKGVPLLIDAVRALAHADMRLVLVGGWESRGMRRFVEEACAHDRRITAGHGDPLPLMRGARLCVHPSYNDGFGYAPTEALACGVPAIVSEDTGMKELIDPGRNGLVVPTGDLDALTAALDAAYRGELFDD